MKNHHHRLRPKIRIKQQANHRRLRQINQQHMAQANQRLRRIKGRPGAVENNFDMNSTWKEASLEELVEPDSPITYGVVKPGREGSVRFIRGGDIANGQILIGQLRTITKEVSNIYQRTLLKSGELVVSLVGNPGQVAIVPHELQGANIARQVGLVRLQNHVKTKFVYYYLLSQEGQASLGAHSLGSVQRVINLRDLKTVKIHLPSSEEQELIADILSSFDDKIELLRRQNKSLEQIARTIFKESFVKDKIWDGNLSEFLKVQGGYAFKSENFKEDGFAGIIKITNITMGVVDIHNTQFVDENIVTNIDEDKFRVKDGDFLIAMTGAEIGKIGVVEKTKKQIWLNQRVGKLVAKVPYGDIAGYLALRSREGQEHIIDAASGSAQANISSTGIEEMAFVPYSETDTNSFGEKVKPLFDKITFNLSQIQTLSRLRDALLPKLMKGEIRVKL